MYRRICLALLGTAILSLGTASALAQTGAKTSGNWNDPTIWTGGAVPGSGDLAFIGSTFPLGSASTATVTLTQNESADTVFLGYSNSGGLGTLNLGSNTLTIGGGGLNLGVSGGSGQLLEGPGGSFSASSVSIYNGNTLSFGTGDTAAILFLSGSTATTAATGNLTGNVSVTQGSTVNMGANMSLPTTATLDVEDTGSIVHMNSYNISAGTIQLGVNSGAAVTIDRGTTPGSLTANALEVQGGGGTFNQKQIHRLRR